MNASTDQIHTIVSLFSEEVHRIIVFVPGHGTVDACAAAMAWAEVLRSQGKELKLVAPTSLGVSSEELPGVEEFSHELGADNLIISLPYVERKIDLVTSHVGGNSGQFYITVKPKAGEKPLNVDDVTVTHGGVSADALVLLGVNDIAEMEPFVSEHHSLFNEVPSLVMLKNGTPEFGSIRMKGEYGRSLCEESSQLFMQLGWEVNEVAATALLRGIELATDYLSAPSATAETFEAVATLLRAGAKRIRRPVVQRIDASKIIAKSAENTDGSSPKSLAEILAERQAQLKATVPFVARSTSERQDIPNTAERKPEQKPYQQKQASFSTSSDKSTDSKRPKRRRRRRKNQTNPIKGYSGRN